MSPAKELPAWYRRVRALEVARKEVGKDLGWDAFDEDLSDLEPGSDADDDDTPAVRCDISDHDSDCARPSPDASDDDMDDEDGLSERSYNGPDADDYYRLKGLREDRKRELIEAKEELEELMESDLKDEAVMVKKIQAAIKAVRNAESRGDAPAPYNSVANTMFHVFCVDYVKHCFCEWARSRKYVQFTYHVPDKDYGFKAMPPPNFDTKIHGQIYLTSDQCVLFEQFYPPREAGP